MTRTPVLFIGLDAMDPQISRELADDGGAPVLEELWNTAAWATTAGPFGLIGALWPSVWTGVWPSRHGYYWPWQLITGTYEHRRTSPADIEHEPFWASFADSGGAVHVLDVPQLPLQRAAQYTQVREWGTHDRVEGPASLPASALVEMEREVGPYAVGTECDVYTERNAWHELRDDLVRGVDQKTRVTKRILSAGSSDLVVTVFQESHCAGHQLWPFYNDARSDTSSTGAREADPLTDVYRALDRGLGELLDAAGSETTTVVLLSHGFGAPYGCDHLLGEVLRRLGESYGKSGPIVTARERVLRPLDRWRHERQFRRAFPDRPPALTRMTSVDSSKSFFKVTADGVHSGVRFNVKGREPRGVVAPGTELETLITALRSDLLDLVDPDTGERSIDAVERVTDLYHGEQIDHLPDLLIVWNPRAGAAATGSPRVGVVSAAPYEGRAGEHRTGGVLFVRGPGIRPGPVGEIQIVDIAPTIATMLGVDAADFDGQMIAVLLPTP